MDGSGKSTVAEILESRLRVDGRSIRTIAHPSRDTRIGRIGHKLLKTEGKPALIFAIIFYIMDVLRSLVIMKRDKGNDIIFVRYSMAVAYLPDELCKKAYRIIERVLPTPDMKFLVDVDAPVAMGRISARGEDLEVFETQEKLDRIRSRMLSISDGWIIINNDGTVEDLVRQMDAVTLPCDHSA